MNDFLRLFLRFVVIILIIASAYGIYLAFKNDGITFDGWCKTQRVDCISSREGRP